ncbi:UNVERIFIED_CONTAM: hypothetical protein GTU68_029410 [Idotea baltica]|nr:hypothetical protein [Idotea baltica]
MYTEVILAACTSIHRDTSKKSSKETYDELVAPSKTSVQNSVLRNTTVAIHRESPCGTFPKGSCWTQ